ncbi:MAG: helix-turn-helix transcriptional regulator [Solirubrobacteraceae bacterium]
MIVDNPSFVPLRSTLALAIAADDPAQASDLARTELNRARELGQPRGIGLALRALGLLEHGEGGIALLDQAVDTLRASPARLELGRALCDLGAATRRHRERAAAREPLREGLALAERCGAEALAARARAELLATGARLRREHLAGPDSLTPSEHRVAELAAAGLPNREIAQGLFVTTKTVGTHLGHIYQKLDLQGEAHARERIGELLRLGTGMS